LAGSVAFTLASVGAATCHAESRPQPWLQTYRYRLTPKPNFARAALEELIVLGGEGLQYWKDRQLNSEDWDLDYNWTSFEQKLTGAAYSFDTNRFETNFAYHPAAGTLYYLAPRNNRLTVLESLGFAFATSTVWEVIAEFRERVSINDMWVTPLSGLSLGEATAQLGAFFDRGCASDLNRALGFAFGPLQTLHDSIDGVAPLRARSCDQLGFDAASEHRFRASVGVAELRAAPGQVYQVTRAKLSTAIVNLPDGDGPRHGWRPFADGNVSELTLALAYGASDISEALIDARVTLAGAEYRNLQPGAGALRLGDRALFGVVVGTQYSLHRYLPGLPMDRVFLIDAPAVTIRFSGRRRGYGFALALDAGGTFGGMDALALDAYRRRFGQLGLTVIADQQRYNYVAGVALAPSARLELQGAELGIAGRSERVTAIRALQRYTGTSTDGTATDHELRRRGEAWISVGPRIGPRLTFSVEATARSGDLGDSQRSLHELGAGLSFEAAL
jgi:hypothetical protein